MRLMRTVKLSSTQQCRSHPFDPLLALPLLFLLDLCAI